MNLLFRVQLMGTGDVAVPCDITVYVPILWYVTPCLWANVK
jgi:hypothetical protein